MRKDVLNPKGFKLFDEVDLTTNQTSNIVYVPYLDNVGIILIFAGTGNVGELFVEVSNQQENPNESMVWTALDFGSQINIADTGTHAISIAQIPFNAIRLKYVAASGTGTLTAFIEAKMV